MAALPKHLVGEAGLIFEGTITRVQATTTSAMPTTPDMAVVRINKILKGPAVFAKFAGREITIQLQRPGTAQPDQRAVYFTTGVHFGDGVVVKELGRHEIHGPEFEADVDAAMTDLHEDELVTRLRHAELIVSGVAIRVGPVQTSYTPSRVSEHDPDWWECLIKFDNIIKGTTRPAGRGGRVEHEVVTHFAHSTDIVWYKSPKFNEGDTGIWLLHGSSVRDVLTPGLVTDHPLDFHPLSRIDHIRGLHERRGQ